MVREMGLEPTRLNDTRPSNVPVYLFQHSRIGFCALSGAKIIIAKLAQLVKQKKEKTTKA